MKRFLYLSALIILNTVMPTLIHAQDPFSGGTGTEKDPYKITNTSDLILMRDYCGSSNTNKHFRLVNNITITASWTPIGNGNNSTFTGYFHGGGHTISELRINNRDMDYAGLFGYNEGTIDSLTIEGTVKGGQYAGGLVGRNAGTIIACHANVSVDASSASSDAFAGGLAAHNTGDIHSSSAKGNVSASGSTFVYSGGLIGYNSTTYEVTDCFARGDVDAMAYQNGNAYSGGLIGRLYSGAVAYCYTTGTPSAIIGTGIKYTGTVIGSNTNGSISDCYFNNDNTGSTPAVGNENGTADGKSSDGMKSRDVYDGWDFNNVWGINGDYPYLRDKPLRFAEITVAPGVLTPVFNPDIFNYTVDVDGSVATIVISAKSTIDEAAVSGTGSQTLIIGRNQFPIIITHHGGELVDTITVHLAYTMDFDTNGGTAVQPINITSKVYTLPVTERKGYDFKEWNTKPSGDSISYTDKTVQNASGINKLYAQWTAKKYTLHFSDSEGSVTPPSKSVTYDSIIGELPELVRTGYNFDGWNTLSDKLGNTYVKDTVYKADHDTTVYAKWTPIDYILYLKSNYIGGTDPDEQQVTYGKSVTLLPDARPGYEFKEWNDKEDGSGKIYTVPFTYEEDKDMTLYAQWTAKSYTLQFDTQCEIGNPQPRKVTYDASVETLPLLGVRTHYTFDGWNTTPDGTGDTYPDNATYRIDDDTTFYAKWTGKSHTISFDDEGCSPQDVHYGSPVGAFQCNPVRPGYTLTWNTASDGTGITYDASTKVAGDAHLYAVWTANTYKLTYHPNGGTVDPTSVSVTYGKTVELPKPTRTNYVFKEWNTKKDGTGDTYNNNNNNNSTPYNTDGDMDIYAQWTGEQYILIFDAQSGNVSPSEQDVKYGSPVGYLPDPVRSGYKFDGWYTEIGGSGTLYTSSTTTPYEVAGNTTLYANWTAKQYQLNLNYNYSGANPASSTGTVTYGIAVGSLGDPTRINYDFKEWNTKADGTGIIYNEKTIYSVAGDMDIYAQWTGKQYQLTFITNETGVPNPPIQYVYYDSPVGKLPADIRLGYTNTWEDDNNKLYDENTRATGNATLHALWTPKNYTLTFNAQGGSVTPPSQSVSYGDVVSELPKPTRSGYKFEGWYSAEYGGGKEYTSTSPYKHEVAGNSSIYAKWTGNPYILSFDSQGGDETPDPRTVTYGSSVGTLPDPGDLLHYVFKEWNTQAKGDGVAYKDGDPYTIKADNATLYAIWTGDPYTLILYPNDGSVDPQSIPKHYGDKVGTLPTPSRPGYTFTEWNTKQDGDGKKYDGNETVEGKIELYAQWTVRTYTITFIPNYTGGEPISIVDIHYDNLVSPPELAKRDHYTFKGWSMTADGNGEIYNATIKYHYDKDITLYAVWLGDPCIVTFNVNATAPDASHPEARSIPYGSPVGPLPVDIRPGYTSTWKDANSVIYLESTEITGDVALYAQWTAKQYTLFFYFNATPDGDVTPKYKPVIYDKVVEDLPAPTRAGYDFKEWNTVPDGNNGTSYTASTIYKVSVNTSLYAQWTAKKYKLTFNATGGTVDEESRLVDYKSKLTSLPLPTRTGYKFTTWNTAKDGSGTTYGNEKTYDEFGDTTLYAQWTAEKYTITFNNNGGGDDPASQDVVYDKAIGTLPSITREGYVFNGWNIQSDGSGTSFTAGTDIYTIAGNETFYAQWTGIFYTLNLDANDGVVSSTSQLVQYGSPVGKLPNPTREGYTFNGWNGNQDGSGTLYTETMNFNKAQNTTVYAQWTIINYTVDFDINYTGGAFPSSAHADYGAYITLPSSVTRTGYTFEGWKDDGGTNYAAGDKYHVIDNATLYAQWTANKYTITFEAGDGVDNPKPIEVTYDSQIGTLYVLTRTDYIFIGWFTGSGVQYIDNAKYETDGNITLYAKWEEVKYTLDFDINYQGGVILPSQSERSHSTVTLPSPVRPGYTLAWNTAADGSGTSYAPEDEYTVTGNITFHAQWTANGYNLNFDAQGGSSVDSQPVTYDKPVGALHSSERTGYTFEGWFTEKNGGGVEYNTAGKVYTTADNTTLYALWKVIVYNIRFDVNYTGSSITIDDKPIAYGAVLKTLPAVQRAGYNHAGWNTARDGSGEIYTEDSEYLVTDNTTLYAQWEAEKYTISFDSQGGTSVSDHEVTYNSKVGELDVPERSGYTFDGWLDSNGVEYTSFTVYEETKGITLSAQWTAGEYTLKFDTQGGDYVDNQQATYGAAVTSLPETKRKGYTFGGWFTETDGAGTRYAVTTPYSTAGDMTLYAKWTINTYTLNFDAQGGDPVAGLPVNYNDLLTGIPVPERTGYTFKGWNISKDGSGIAYNENNHYTIDGDATLYAQWKANEYTLDFDAQGGDPVNSQQVTYDATIKTLPNSTRTGYIFGGWFTGINGGGIQYSETDKYTATAGTTLYAQWTARKYLLGFNVNYTGADSNPASRDVVYGSTAGGGESLPVPQRQGYTFTEWNTEIDGSGVKYISTTVYTATGNTTLYAQWTGIDYTLSFEANYIGEVMRPENPPSKDIVYGSAVGTLPTLTHAGYIFIEWNTAKNGGGKTYTATTTYSVIGNTTLYARWEGIGYTVNFAGSNVELDPQPVTHGAKIVRPSDPTLQGSVFAGWYKDNDLWDFNTPVTGDILLTAKWYSSDVMLRNLSINRGVLSPEFRPSITNYTVTVSYDVATIGVTGLPNYSEATVTGNVENKSLSVGDNVIRIIVTAEDGVNTQTYTVLAVREDHIMVSDANILSLTANKHPVTLTGNTLEYAAGCGETSFALDLDVSPYASVAINGTPYEKGQIIPMTGGAEGVTETVIHIVSETGVTKDYILKANAPINEDRLYYRRWPDILGVNANPDNNGHYEVQAYRWYKYDGSYAGDRGYIQTQTSGDYAEIQTVQTEGWHHVCGTPQTRSLEKISAYPNPVSSGESVKLELPEQFVGATLNIYSVTGALIKSGTPLPASTNSVDVSGFGTGIYLFNITAKDGANQSVKIIIE